MTRLDLTCEAFIAAAPELVSSALRHHALAGQLWPGQQLQVLTDRGRAGIRLLLQGPWRGSSELWLEPGWGGVVVHAFLRAELDAELSDRALRLERERQFRHQQQVLWRFKDTLEASRGPGEDSVGSQV